MNEQIPIPPVPPVEVETIESEKKPAVNKKREDFVSMVCGIVAIASLLASLALFTLFLFLFRYALAFTFAMIGLAAALILSLFGLNALRKKPIDLKGVVSAALCTSAAAAAILYAGWSLSTILIHIDQSYNYRVDNGYNYSDQLPENLDDFFSQFEEFYPGEERQQSDSFFWN